jgi:ferrous iron transport protein A
VNNNFTLSSVPVGQPVQLAKIQAGRRLKHRLTELGLTPGVTLTIIQNNGGPVLLSVRDSRIAIGREMANKIQVTQLDERISIQKQPTKVLVNQSAK